MTLSPFDVFDPSTSTVSTSSTLAKSCNREELRKKDPSYTSVFFLSSSCACVCVKCVYLGHGADIEIEI